MVPHIVRSCVGLSTIDKYPLSILVDFGSQITHVGRPRSAETPGFPAIQAGFDLDRRNCGGYKNRGERPSPLERARISLQSLPWSTLLTPPLSPNTLVSGISATDGRQHAFHASCDQDPAQHQISSLTGLHLPYKTRLQLVIFSHIIYLYKPPEKRAKNHGKTASR